MNKMEKKNFDFSTKNPDLQGIQSKVAGKIVRIIIADKREYVGIFGSIDKTGALFIMDAVEMIETNQEAENATIFHELYTPY